MACRRGGRTMPVRLCTTSVFDNSVEPDASLKRGVRPACSGVTHTLLESKFFESRWAGDLKRFSGPHGRPKAAGLVPAGACRTGGQGLVHARPPAAAGLVPVIGGAADRLTLLKGLILAQNERWRRGLGMQVERIPGGNPRGKWRKGQ